MTNREVLTIGHSNHPIEKFLDLLASNGVTAVADVRSAPYSRFNPQFNKDTLSAELKRHGITYVFLGKELRARSNDPWCYENGRVQYGRLARTKTFKEGLERVRLGAENNRIALMCAEREPLECHRTLLVARALEAIDVRVAHILSDGRIEPHRESLRRLPSIVGLPENDMFRTQEDLIEAACTRQEERVAYVDEALSAENSGRGT